MNCRLTEYSYSMLFSTFPLQFTINMWSIQLFYAFLKLLRFVFHLVGFLRLSYDRSKERYEQCEVRWYKDYLPGVVIFIFICVHFYLLLEMEYFYCELREIQPEALPPFDFLDLLIKLCHDVMYLLLVIICLAKRNQLYQVVCLAQLCYKHLRSLLKERFELRCSERLFLLGISQFLLLLVCCIKLFWLDWPLLDEYNICDYIMGAVRLLFVLVLSLQFFYHLLHAALLQSLNLVLQQHMNLKLLHQLLRVQPLLKKLQHSAACYFGYSFCCFFALLCLRCGMFVGVFTYDEQRFMPRRSNHSDNLDDEMDPLEMPMPPTRNELLKSESFFLAWQVALMWLLLSVALVQQSEHNKLLSGIWKLDFPSEVAASELSKNSLVTKDVVSFLVRINNNNLKENR